MAKTRRTKKAYTDLYDNPKRLFEGVETILFPNGMDEIWFRTPGGLGVQLRVSRGPAGLGIRITPLVHTPHITVPASDNHPPGSFETDYLEVVQYGRHPYAQAFKQWAFHGGEFPEELNDGSASDSEG